MLDLFNIPFADCRSCAERFQANTTYMHIGDTIKNRFSRQVRSLKILNSVSLGYSLYHLFMAVVRNLKKLSFGRHKQIVNAAVGIIYKLP